MAIPTIFVRISILIILNVFLRSPFVNSEIMKSDNFTENLELDPPDLDAHFRKSYGTRRVELTRDETYVRNQALEDLDEMCRIAMKQSGYIDPNRSASSSSGSRTNFQKNAAFMLKNIKDTLYSKLLYKCGEGVPKSNCDKTDDIHEIFEIFIAPSEKHPRRGVVFRLTKIDEVELIGAVQEAFFPLK